MPQRVGQSAGRQLCDLSLQPRQQLVELLAFLGGQPVQLHALPDQPAQGRHRGAGGAVHRAGREQLVGPVGQEDLQLGQHPGRVGRTRRAPVLVGPGQRLHHHPALVNLDGEHLRHPAGSQPGEQGGDRGLGPEEVAGRLHEDRAGRRRRNRDLQDRREVPHLHHAAPARPLPAEGGQRLVHEGLDRCSPTGGEPWRTLRRPGEGAAVHPEPGVDGLGHRGRVGQPVEGVELEPLRRGHSLGLDEVHGEPRVGGDRPAGSEGRHAGRAHGPGQLPGRGVALALLLDRQRRTVRAGYDHHPSVPHGRHQVGHDEGRSRRRRVSATTTAAAADQAWGRQLAG